MVPTHWLISSSVRRRACSSDIVLDVVACDGRYVASSHSHIHLSWLFAVALTSRAALTIMASCLDHPRTHEACCQQSFNRILCRKSFLVSQSTQSGMQTALNRLLR